jgi:S1-C subfamily serine protease
VALRAKRQLACALVPGAVVALALAAVPHADSGQAASVLHIKIVLGDVGFRPVPVAHHVLLISDNPPGGPPRRVVTGLDGTAEVKLRPGTYTVESEQPVALAGKSYEWAQFVDIVAGRDAVIELTAANAEVSSASGPSESDPSFLFARWQNSVVALWTPSTHASGFLIDARGLVATNQRVVGNATSVDVQVTPDVKVEGRVVAMDSARNVAVLWIDPKVAASTEPIPLACAQAAKPPVAGRQEIFTIGIPLRQPKRMTWGNVMRVERDAIVSDLILPPGSTGGPVFRADGTVIGITSPAKENDEGLINSHAVPIDKACDVIATAEAKIKDAAPPAGTPLPVEPTRPFPADALEDAAKHRAGSLSPYSISSSSFDVGFITPVLTYGVRYQAEQAARRVRDKGRSAQPPDPPMLRPVMDFGSWSEYFADFPPVLLVRITPKFAESFWTTLARGAARTQGVSVPPIKRFKSGFSRMRAFCGDAEVTPIHRFTLETRVSDKDAIDEGLYVFAPDSIGPQCATVKLELYSQKEQDKGESALVDPGVVQKFWQDFAPYRALSR